MSQTQQLSRQLRDHLTKQQPEMVTLLKAMAEIESPSHDPQSQEEIFDLLRAVLEERGFRTERKQGKETGGHLLAVPGHRTKDAQLQLLLGHCDTVWPHGTSKSMPVEEREGKLFGPGVYDMKAGLVQAVFAVGALRELGIEPDVSPMLMINADEEIGSPESTESIKHYARLADRAFVMEPSLGPHGQLKTARKGVGKFTVRVTGKAAHAGLDPKGGVSAILELSHVVQSLFALNNPERGITVNVGTIDGGLRPNVIAPEAKAEADVRVLTHDDARQIESAIHSLQPSIPGTELHITGRIGRPPLEQTPANRRLWEAALEIADDLDIELQEGTAGGGSDGNTTSLTTATLDGLGAVGDGAHAVHEHVIIEYMPQRAALLAGLLALPLLRQCNSNQPSPLRSER